MSCVTPMLLGHTFLSCMIKKGKNEAEGEGQRSKGGMLSIAFIHYYSPRVGRVKSDLKTAAELKNLKRFTGKPFKAGGCPSLKVLKSNLPGAWLKSS